MGKTIELTKKNFEAEVLQSNLPVLVDFWAPWCGPCKMMAPILEELAEDIGTQVKIAKVNTEDGDNGELAEAYNVQGIPNMKLFKGGQIIAEFVGARPKDTLKAEIIKALN